MMSEGTWWILPVTVLLAAVLARVLVPPARAVGLVDQPGGRKVHDVPTPLTGGTAIFLALVLVLGWTMPGDRFAQSLLAGGALMLLIGLADDRFGVSVPLRFVAQVAACLLVMVLADVRLEDFGSLLTPGVLELGAVSAPVTIFAAMGVINAYNLMDGMDGLSGAIFLVAAAGMALFAGLSGQPQLLWLLLLAMAAVCGFLLLNARLPWNPRARVFLGDSGSLLLGFILAWCFIWLGSDHDYVAPRAYMPMTAVWLAALPLLDTTTLIWRRWRSGKSPFEADQQHLHHAFLRAGFTVGQTWLAITALALLLAGIGIAFELLGAPGYASFWTFMACALAYYFYTRENWEKQRFLGRDFVYNDLRPADET